MVGGEGGERPDDVDQILMRAFFSRPHVMVAVRKLPDLARMDFDRLRDIELDALAGIAENGFDRRENCGFERQCLRPGRALHQRAESFGAMTVEIPAPERCRGEDRIEIGVERPNRIRRQDRKSTRLNSSHYCASRMPSSACKKPTHTAN